MITATHLVTSHDGANATSYQTASIAPSGNTLVLAAILNRVTSGTGGLPSLSGNGLTWVEVSTRLFDSDQSRISLFRAMGAAPSSGAVTIAFGATQNHCGWSIAEFSGVESSGSDGENAVRNAAEGTTTGTTLTVSYPGAFTDAVNNACYGACAVESNRDLSFVTAGFTELGEVALSSPTAELMSGWKLGEETSVQFGGGGSSSIWGGIVAEIVAGAVGQPMSRRFSGVPGLGRGLVIGRSW